jgi:hypothetical protein
MSYEDSLENDNLLPSQYFASRGGAGDPVKRMLVALLEDAIRCVQGRSAAFISGPTRPVGKRRAKLEREAREWFEGACCPNKFSFVDVCQALGFEPSSFRARVLSGQRIEIQRTMVSGDSANLRPVANYRRVRRELDQRRGAHVARKI